MSALFSIKTKMSKDLVKKIGKGAIWTGEKILSEMALISALASTTQNGNIPERIAGGIYVPIKAGANLVYSYLKNEGIRDTLNGAAVGIMQGIGNLGTNIAEHPEETIYSLIGTYGLCKAVPMASKYLRKKSNRKSILKEE